MGAHHTKDQRVLRNDAVEGLKQKVMLLQEEVNEIMCMRDVEIQAYEREMMVFAFKEAEWKKENRKLKEEVKKLRKRLEDYREEGLKGMELHELLKGGKLSNGKDWVFLGPDFLLDQVRRDDAVEKWKQLYFAIKVELDDLIQRTNKGEGLCWKAETEEMLEELRKELMNKEKTISFQQCEIATMKQEENKREREIDILRQSLKIMCHNKKGKKNS
ncbi:OLC1v1019462C1 [Oldenlandia corymbosa var. corymbosa]|uniref:OLC1v1019462C1 n=1 Tax=Oldenlandia corymbosa var. corymbosa TaxID=529605 RepID=A0AAV1EEG1_OLDCO|nr:OLC1v1019462C1 [Oldenlandia corymbosa var. corymbosa]